MRLPHVTPPVQAGTGHPSGSGDHTVAQASAQPTAAPVPGEPAPASRRHAVPHIARRLRNLLPGYEHKRLRQAVKDGDVRTVRKLLARGADPFQRFSDGGNALRLALERGQYDVFAALLKDTNIDRPAHPVNQLAHWLSQHDDRAVDVLLSDPRVDLNRQDAHGDALLHTAAREGRLRWARALARPEDPEDTRQRADPTLKNNEGLTPLHLAARFDARVLQHLLGAGVDANLQDDRGRTALHHAVASSRREMLMEVLSMLIRAGADPGVTDANGKTPIEYAMTFVDKDLMVEAVVAVAGTAPNAKDSDGRTPLHQAVASAPAEALKEVIAALVAVGANPMRWDKGNKTAFERALTSLDREVLREVIVAMIGNAPDATDVAERTPLHQAVASAPEEMLAEIIAIIASTGANMNARDASGRTALHLALNRVSSENLPAVIRSLLVAGADPDAADQARKTPRRLAAERLKAGRAGPEVRDMLINTFPLPPELRRRIGGLLPKPARDSYSQVNSLAHAEVRALRTSWIFRTPEDLEEAMRRVDVTRLREITLGGGDKFTDEDLQQLAHCPELKVLDIRWCTAITDAAIAHLPRGLKRLNAGHCSNLTDACVGVLPAELEELILNDIDGLAGANMEDFPASLKKLDLSGCADLTGEAIKKLPAALENLDLSGCALLTDDAPNHLPEGLKELVLRDCTSLTNEGVTRLGQRVQGLRELDITGCEEITAEGLGQLPANLEVLVLQDSEELNDAAAARLAARTPGLTSLNARGASALTDAGLRNLPGRLEKLVLSGCTELTDDGVAAMAARLTGLKRLSLDWTRITGACIGHLPRGLEDVAFRECQRFDGTHLRALPPQLRKLDISGCKIKDGHIDQLPGTLENLDLGSNPDITSNAIARIPRGVKRLNLEACENLADGAIQHLPRMLEVVRLGFIPLTQDCVADLPATLTFVDFGANDQIGEDVVQGLRNRGVTVLNVPETDLDESGAEFDVEGDVPDAP